MTTRARGPSHRAIKDTGLRWSRVFERLAEAGIRLVRHRLRRSGVSPPRERLKSADSRRTKPWRSSAPSGSPGRVLMSSKSPRRTTGPEDHIVLAANYSSNSSRSSRSADARAPASASPSPRRCCSPPVWWRHSVRVGSRAGRSPEARRRDQSRHRAARRARRGSRAGGSRALLLIQLDTPGGLERSMRVIVQHPTPRYPSCVLGPTGARAASAGVSSDGGARRGDGAATNTARRIRGDRRRRRQESLRRSKTTRPRCAHDCARACRNASGPRKRAAIVSIPSAGVHLRSST